MFSAGSGRVGKGGVKGQFGRGEAKPGGVGEQRRPPQMPNSALPASHCAHSQDRATGVEASRAGRVLWREKKHGSELGSLVLLAMPLPQSQLSAWNEGSHLALPPSRNPLPQALWKPFPFPLINQLEQKTSLLSLWIVDPF